MAIHTTSPTHSIAAGPRVFGRTRIVLLVVLAVLMSLALAFAWSTRDAMAHLPFLARKGSASSLASRQKTLVDLRPWQTAQTLSPLAVTSEEAEFASEAERLADHEVLQAFASALRLANLQAQRRVLTGEALELSKKVQKMEKLVSDDQAQVQSLTPTSDGQAKDAALSAANSDALEIAKAQLELDSDQLADAQHDLGRAVGDNRGRIENELAAHQAAVAKLNADRQNDHQGAVLSAAQRATLLHRLDVFQSQNDRYRLVQQAMQQAQADVVSLTSEHNALEAQAKQSASASAVDPADHAARLASMRSTSAEQQLLGIYDERIQTNQELEAAYSKWSAQILLQHRIVQHMIMQSVAIIFLIIIATVLCDGFMRRLLAHPAVDRRQVHMLRTILQLSVQFLGALLVLFVFFGFPQQFGTILGLTTAGLTIALQDFILAFVGWFFLIGKNGIRVGDWVEINGVGGEVIEIDLMSTTLLENGDLAELGHPTGRSISFLNSFAIRGQYFNFSTTHQWMWDEIVVNLPSSSISAVQSIRDLVVDDTAENALLASQEWKRGKRDDGLSRFNAAPVITQRPSLIGINLRIRYVTRASERFVVRNRLYQRIIDQIQIAKVPTLKRKAIEESN